jgi:hypothetical protein
VNIFIAKRFLRFWLLPYKKSLEVNLLFNENTVLKSLLENLLTNYTKEGLYPFILSPVMSEEGEFNFNGPSKMSFSFQS